MPFELTGGSRSDMEYEMAEPRDSHSRCPDKKRLVDLHYQLFLERDPVIQSFFSGTDVNRHKESLRAMHTAFLMFARGDELAERFLRQVAEKHGPSGMNIPVELYDHWLNSMVEAVAECDPAFNPEVELAWREAGKKGVRLFVDIAKAKEDSR